MTTLYPFQQRVIDERADLDAKIKKLADFIVLNPLFKDLPGHEKDRLYRQHTAMRAYSGVLGERIEAAQRQAPLLPPEEPRQPVQEGLL